MSAHVHGLRTALTLVTETGVTFTACDCGALATRNGLVSPRLGRRIVNGDVLVTTPHRAGGAYRGREEGGVYATINPKATLRSYVEQAGLDPRTTAEVGLAIAAKSEVFYGRKG